MSITNCRGDEAKKEIVAGNILTPIARLMIKPGNSVSGCCGELTDEQVIFSYKPKSGGEGGEFSVGMDCAEQFLRLIGKPMPDLVNPFQSVPSQGGGGSSAGKNANSVGLARTPLNEELYFAINLWCSLRGQVPKYKLGEILAVIERNPDSDIDVKYVYDFLKVVASYRSSLATLVAVPVPGKKLKNFSFPKLNSMAAKNWIDLP